MQILGILKGILTDCVVQATPCNDFMIYVVTTRGKGNFKITPPYGSSISGIIRSGDILRFSLVVLDEAAFIERNRAFSEFRNFGTVASV